MSAHADVRRLVDALGVDEVVRLLAETTPEPNEADLEELLYEDHALRARIRPAPAPSTYTDEADLEYAAWAPYLVGRRGAATLRQET